MTCLEDDVAYDYGYARVDRADAGCERLDASPARLAPLGGLQVIHRIQ
jgi:hypothetical protein